MVGRRGVNEEVWAELGYMAVTYSGLEELLIMAIAALLNPGERGPAKDVASRMRFQEKVNTLRRLFQMRCEQVGLDVNAPMNAALNACQTAGEIRNGLIHGIAEFAGDELFMTRPGHTARPITMGEVQRANRAIGDAYLALAGAFARLWNPTKGQFGRRVGVRAKKIAIESVQSWAQKKGNSTKRKA